MTQKEIKLTLASYRYSVSAIEDKLDLRTTSKIEPGSPQRGSYRITNSHTRDLFATNKRYRKHTNQWKRINNDIRINSSR